VHSPLAPQEANAEALLADSDQLALKEQHEAGADKQAERP
jgi:hypothetical protein